jgi:undecaprenyl-diphosphatase
MEVARRADHMLCCVALAGVLPHLFKRLIDRERPDRVVVHGRRHGIPRSGNAWDSFPSGHALHLGAIAGSVARFCPRRFRRFVWPSITALAATRILLLAHYLSDVVAGLALGVALDWGVGRLFGEGYAASSRHRPEQPQSSIHRRKLLERLRRESDGAPSGSLEA